MPDHPITEVHVIPVLEETVQVRSERVETGAVRVRIETQEFPEVVPLPSWEETTEVERLRIDRAVDERLEPWREGDVLVVPVYEERVVVHRVLVLVEEVRLRTVRHTRTGRQEVLLRREQAHIERRSADGPWHDDEDTTPRAPPVTPPQPTSDKER